MFTGIIRATATVADVAARGDDARIAIDCPALDLSRCEIGASIAVNGVCLTAVTLQAHGFAADVSAHTLEVTTLGALRAGSSVNLEPALRLGDALDGHWVTGHVDGVAQVREIEAGDGAWRLRFGMPAALARYVAQKGSVAVDGVSLTVNAVTDDSFDVAIIPHTREQTIIGHYAVGTAVNIEVDIVARYMERLVSSSS